MEDRSNGRSESEIATCRFGTVRDENRAEIPRFTEIRHRQKRCSEEIDVLFTIATGVRHLWGNGWG